MPISMEEFNRRFDRMIEERRKRGWLNDLSQSVRSPGTRDNREVDELLDEQLAAITYPYLLEWEAKLKIKPSAVRDLTPDEHKLVWEAMSRRR